VSEEAVRDQREGDGLSPREMMFSRAPLVTGACRGFIGDRRCVSIHDCPHGVGFVLRFVVTIAYRGAASSIRGRSRRGATGAYNADSPLAVLDRLDR
jgi:hypothetical protein